MYKQTLHTLITDFKRLRGGCSSLRIKHLQCCVLGLEPGLCLLYLQWSNKPTQVNSATPLICSSETSSFFPAFCHSSLKCFSHTQKAFVGGWCLQVGASRKRWPTFWICALCVQQWRSLIAKLFTCWSAGAGKSSEKYRHTEKDAHWDVHVLYWRTWTLLSEICRSSCVSIT